MNRQDEFGFWVRLRRLLRLGGAVVPESVLEKHRRTVFAVLDVTMAMAAAAVISSLALEHGFYEHPVRLGALHAVQVLVLAAFVLDRLIRLALAPVRRAFLRENWIDFALIAGAGLAAAAASRLRFGVLSMTSVYIAITQVYILVVLVLRMVGLHLKVAASGIHPAWVLIGSFVTVILFGTGLLMLPSAAPAGAPFGFLDALFTATSANCVTGLTVRDTAGLSVYGQAVILVLIQVGGLGIMIFGTVFVMLAGRNLSVRESLLAGQALPSEAVARIGKVAVFAVVGTLAFEAVGAGVMYPMWRGVDVAGNPSAPVLDSVFRSVFHSVSAFCNAGFALQSDSLVGVRDDWRTIGVIAPLIVLGGLGFPVLYDLARLGRSWGRRLLLGERRTEGVLSLHSKIVLSLTVLLIVFGAVGLTVIEHSSDKGRTFGAPQRYSDDYVVGGEPVFVRLPWPQRVREAVFQSVTARTAGFNTVSMDALSEGGKFWMCLLMMVGGSPASTAGGMKVTTLAIIALTVWSAVRRREQVEAFRRALPEASIRRAMILATLYLLLVGVVALVLFVHMSDRRLPPPRSTAPTGMQLFFEAASACGTVGLSCGVTASLGNFGKLAVTLGMLVGRLGPLTLLVALTARQRAGRYTYPHEEVILG